MARQRLIKPEFFQHDGLHRADTESGLPCRLAFIGLWTQADRRGLFRWEPARLKLNVLPFDEINFSDVLDVLERHGFIESYVVDGKKYGRIPTFCNHQSFHNKETINSSIPEPDPSTGKARGKPRARSPRTPGKQGASPTGTVSITAPISVTGIQASPGMPDRPRAAGGWPAEAAALWSEKVGPITPSLIGAKLKPLVDAHGWDAVKAGLSDYITATPTPRAAIPWFVERGTYWVNLAKQPGVDPATGAYSERSRVVLGIT